MSREYPQDNGDGTVSVIRENDDGTYDVIGGPYPTGGNTAPPAGRGSARGSTPGGDFDWENYWRSQVEYNQAMLDWAREQFYSTQGEERERWRQQYDLALRQYNESIRQYEKTTGISTAMQLASLGAQLKGPDDPLGYAGFTNQARDIYSMASGSTPAPASGAPTGYSAPSTIQSLLNQLGINPTEWRPPDYAPLPETPPENTLSEEQALDWIWSNRPDLAAFYRNNGWQIDTPEQQRAAVRNWISDVDPANRGQTPQQVAVRLGYRPQTGGSTVPSNRADPNEFRPRGDPYDPTGGRGVVGPGRDVVFTDMSLEGAERRRRMGLPSYGGQPSPVDWMRNGGRQSFPESGLDSLMPGRIDPNTLVDRQRQITDLDRAYNTARRQTGYDRDDFRFAPPGWQPGQPTSSPGNFRSGLINQPIMGRGNTPPPTSSPGNPAFPRRTPEWNPGGSYGSPAEPPNNSDIPQGMDPGVWNALNPTARDLYRSQGYLVPNPHRINPAVWDSMNRSGQAAVLNAANRGYSESGAWNTDDFLRQLNAARPQGRAPGRVNFNWGRINSLL